MELYKNTPLHRSCPSCRQDSEWFRAGMVQKREASSVRLEGADTQETINPYLVVADSYRAPIAPILFSKS